MSTPMLRTAVCRWCENPIPTPSVGTCPANTRGCGDGCGFDCGCNPSDWNYGPHEPTSLGYSITYAQHKPVFVLVDEGRRRAIEWRFNHLQPIEIIHNSAPRDAADEPMCCNHINGLCYPHETALSGPLAELYRAAGETFDSEVHQQVHAAMWVRWVLG